MPAGSHRYAIYFAPPEDTPLGRFGASWLGRSATAGTRLPQPALPGLSSEQLAEMTADARRYGFHATLKPPFRLAERASSQALHAAAADFARSYPAVAAPPLKPVLLDGFAAFRPSGPSLALDELAAACIRAFDDLRAPPDEAEIARRGDSLTPTQKELLARWGYPYVMQEFRFHMTLTRRLHPAEREQVMPAIHDLAAPLVVKPLRIDDICVFEEPAAGDAFVLTARYALRGAPSRS